MKVYIVTLDKGTFKGIRAFSSLEKADNYISKLDENINYDINSTIIDQYEVQE